MKIPDILRRIARHNALFEAMTNKLELRDTLLEVSKNGETYRRASTRCLSCSQANACAQWLEQETEPEEAPDYCRNSALFARLERLKSSGSEPDSHGSGARPAEQTL